MKRALVMLFSVATIICFGYSLGALAATVAGFPHWRQVFLWLLGGLLATICAVTLWKSYLRELEAENKLKNGCSAAPFE